MARPDYRDDPDRLFRKIDRDGLLHDLRPHAKSTHDGIDYATNGGGFRDDHEYRLEKRPGVRRVVLLGDSFVFGFGLPLAQTMGHQLASLLPATAWEILNFGVPAYDTTDELRFFEQRGLAFRPDVVVLMYHLNDAGLGVPSALGDPVTTEQRLRAYYAGDGTAEERGEVEAFLRTQGRPPAPAWNAPDLPERDRAYFFHHTLPLYWARVEEAFDRLAALGRQHGFVVTVAILPELDRPWNRHPFAPLYAQVREAAVRRGFGVIDLYPLLRRYPNADLMLWGYDGHTSAFANRIIAHALAEHLAAGAP